MAFRGGGGPLVAGEGGGGFAERALRRGVGRES